MNNSLIVPIVREEQQQQVQDQSQIYAMQYYGRICDTARDMRDQYCRGDYNDACASAEQLTENSLNAIGELNGGLSDNYRNHTTLVQRKKDFAPDLSISNRALKRMEKAYINRYPDPNTSLISKNYTKPEAQKMILDACGVADVALDSLNISHYERFNQFGMPQNFNSVDSFMLQHMLFNGTSPAYCYTL
ncbi:hypothetical protein LXJ15735_27420 [Lacrimispora xylanolytica]